MCSDRGDRIDAAEIRIERPRAATKVKHPRWFLFRVELGLAIIRFGVWITGMKCEVKKVERKEKR